MIHYKQISGYVFLGIEKCNCKNESISFSKGQSFSAGGIFTNECIICKEIFNSVEKSEKICVFCADLTNRCGNLKK